MSQISAQAPIPPHPPQNRENQYNNSLFEYAKTCFMGGAMIGLASKLLLENPTKALTSTVYLGGLIEAYNSYSNGDRPQEAIKQGIIYSSSTLAGILASQAMLGIE